MNSWGLLDFLKSKRKYMSEKEISSATGNSQPSTNRMLKSWVKINQVVIRKKPIQAGSNPSRLVKHYKFNYGRK